MHASTHWNGFRCLQLKVNYVCVCYVRVYRHFKYTWLCSFGTPDDANLCLKYYHVPYIYKDFNGSYICVLIVRVQNCECIIQYVAYPTLFCPLDYRSVSTFHRQSRYGAKNLFFSAVEAVVHTWQNAVRRLSASILRYPMSLLLDHS